MTDKLTDSEIVKALRSWLEEIRKSRQAYLEKVNEEHYPSMRYEYLLSDTIHEINRLQADNERLKKDSQRLKKVQMQLDDMCKMHHIIKAEAYKEFAEKLKKKSFDVNSHYDWVVEEKDIDNLLKELVGDGK